MERLKKQERILIGEFMGGKMIVTDYFGINIMEFPDKSTKDICGMKYDSWSMLMEVVEKIESLGFDVTIKGITCSVSRWGESDTILQLVCGDRGQKVMLVYAVVVKFIEWYNKQEKK